MLSRRRRRTAPLLETLEARQFLSNTPTGPVDLSPTGAASIKLASAIITGTAVKGSLKATIANLGTGTSAKGATLAAFLRPAFGSDINITAKPASIPALVGGKSKPVNVSLAVPASLPAGSYTLVLTVSDAGDVSTANDSFTAPFALTAAAGHVVLSGSLAGVPASINVAHNNTTKLQVNLTDFGNIPTAGSAALEITLHPTAGTDIPLIMKNISLPKLKAAGGKGKLAAIPISLPASVPPGTYRLRVAITPTDATINPIAIVSSAITITSGNG